MTNDEQMIAEIEAALERDAKACVIADRDTTAHHVLLQAIRKYGSRFLALAKAGMRLPKCWRLNERGELVLDHPITPDTLVYGKRVEDRYTLAWEVMHLADKYYATPEAVAAARERREA